MSELQLRTYPGGICETTNTHRRATECDCLTYPENLGPCFRWERGSNGRCAYCDHNEACHDDA